MRKMVYSWLVIGLALSACGGSPTPSRTVGTYNGELVIGGTNPFVSVKTTFTVDSKGNLSGTTAPQMSTTQNGTIVGTVTGSNELGLSFNLTFESATLGKYTMTGTGSYVELNGKKALGATNLASKNTSGVYIGDAVFSGTKE